MSTLRVNTIQDASGGDIVNSRGIAKAWVNFNGQGTVAILSGHNVSSITDNGVGTYTVNYTTAMTDANYCHQIGAGTFGVGNVTNMFYATSKTASGLQVYCSYGTSATAGDYTSVNVAIFR